MFCNNCGKPVAMGARFCQACGAAVVVAPPAGPGTQTDPAKASAPQASQPNKKWPLGKVVAICGCLLVVLALGVVAAVFFGIRYALKSSDAYKAAVNSLSQSPVAKRELGETYDISLPEGSVSSEGGGSGSASLSMSIKGKVAKGRYYAVLERRGGQWFVESGRLVLADGRSIDIAGGAALRRGGVRVSAGRQLRSGGADTSTWHEVGWSEHEMRISVPPSWNLRMIDPRHLDIRAGDQFSPVYLVANAWTFERELPVAALLGTELDTESERFRNGVTSGYAVRDVGGVTGILTISPVGDRLTATWKGLVPLGDALTSIDISLGAPSETFDRFEPIFCEILSSVHFGQQAKASHITRNVLELCLESRQGAGSQPWMNRHTWRSADFVHEGAPGTRRNWKH